MNCWKYFFSSRGGVISSPSFFVLHFILIQTSICSDSVICVCGELAFSYQLFTPFNKYENKKNDPLPLSPPLLFFADADTPKLSLKSAFLFVHFVGDSYTCQCLVLFWVILYSIFWQFVSAVLLFFTLITTVVISFLMDAFAVPSVFFRLALFLLFFIYILYILILLIDILTVLVSVASFACFLVLKFGSGIVM